MLKNKAFKQHTEKYDDWFDKNSNAYLCELKTFETLNIQGNSIEIGIGTGKFAAPLRIPIGVEPTSQMYEKSIELGIDIIEAVAEALPLRSRHFDWVVMVTTICFVSDPAKSMSEMHRVLKSGGKCAIGLVDRETELGRVYLDKKDKSDFYKEATFFSSEEVIKLLNDAGFVDIKAIQTLTDITMTSVEEPTAGYGKGGFVVIYGVKP